MAVAYGETLGCAWRRARRMLLEPFDLGTWLVLGFTAWLARLAGGGGGGGSFPVRDLSHVGSNRNFSGVLRIFEREWHRLWAETRWGPLVLVGVVLALVLVVLLLWLSSRGKVIFLDNVARGRAEVREPWRRLGRLGDSLFAFRIAFVGGALGIAGVLIFLTVQIAHGPLGVVAVAVLWATFALLSAFVLLLLDNFVVPIMVRFDLPVGRAWDALLPWVSRDPWAFVVYGLMLLGLAIVVGIGIVAVGLMSCCMGFVLLALPYLGTVLLLPILVAYRALGPEFLSRVDPGFENLLEELPLRH